MVDPFYSWHVGELRTGRLTAEVPVTEGSWQSVMDDAGTLSFTAALSDPAVRDLMLYTAAEPCRCFLAVSYTDVTGTETFLEAGPVWTHSYDSASSSLTVAGTGLWALWDHRKILPVLAPGVSPASVTTTFSGLSLGTVAKGLLQLAMTHAGGDVPLVLPADEAGTLTLEYAGADLAAVGEALRDLAKADGGPEIQFVPRRRADDPRYLEWEMKTGTVAQPLLVQAGDDLIFDQPPSRSQVLSVAVSRDGTKMADRWWAQGGGTDEVTPFGRADDTALIGVGFPLLEGDDAQNDLTDQAELDAAAAAALVAARRPVDTVTLGVHRDGVEGSQGTGDWSGPNAATCRVGSWATFTAGGYVDPVTRTVPKEPYLAPTGEPNTIRARITQVSGDMTPKITLALAPFVEA